MKNVKIIFVVLSMLFLFGCPYKGVEETKYAVKNTTDKSVKVEFFAYFGREKIILDLLPMERKNINLSATMIKGCPSDVMCSDSVRITFADGKSKVDASCSIYANDNGTPRNPKMDECIKDSINFLYTTYAEMPTSYVFYVRDADYREAK